ncbi:MAG: rhodanese-like domain-containing protein [Pyrinomonadaceae bacterium]
MRFIVSLFATLITIFAFTVSFAVPSSRGDDDAKRITVEDAKKAFDAGEAVFVDVRSANSYNVEHIKGAVNIPVGEIEDRYKELPDDKPIIAYCS